MAALAFFLEMSGSSAALAALGEALAAAIEPLAAHLSPRTLARLARTSQSLRQSISGNDAFWAATARHMGLALGSRASLVQHFRSRCVFCCDVVANASVQASVIRLDLGAATPAARRASPRVQYRCALRCVNTIGKSGPTRTLTVSTCHVVNFLLMTDNSTPPAAA